MSRKDWGAILIIAAFYAALMLVGITCPIRFLTGISCAGCGMTRAWLALFRLDLSAAVSYHPLFWLPVPGAAVLLLRRRIPKNLFCVVLVVLVVLFLAVYAFRLLSPEDTVVVFAPEEGLLWQIASCLWN